MVTCWHKLVILAVRVVQELGEPAEELAHVLLLKHLMHRRLHTNSTGWYVFMSLNTRFVLCCMYQQQQDTFGQRRSSGRSYASVLAKQQAFGADNIE